MSQLVRGRDELVVEFAILLKLDTALSVRLAASVYGQSLEIRLETVLQNELREDLLL